MTPGPEGRSSEPDPILVLGNNYPPHTLGGSELLCQDHVRWLRARGHRVTVLTSTYGTAGAQAGSEIGPDGERIVRALDFHWKDFEIRRPAGWRMIAGERRQRVALEAVLDEDRPAAVQVWHMAAISKSLLGVVAGRRLPAIAVVGENWPTWDVASDAWLHLMRRGPRRDRVLTPALRRLVSRVVAPTDLTGAFERIRPAYCSDFLREQVEARFAPWKGRGVTIHNGIDLRLMTRARPEDEPFRSPLRLLYCGRVEQRKGVATAIEALAELGSGDVAARLDIVGWRDEAYAAELRGLAAKLAVADQVRFLDAVPREELPEVYRANDVLVFPTIWEEPFGLVPLEAMAAGCVVVGTGSGGSAEVMIDGRTALLHPIADAKSLADRIVRLSTDPALMVRLRQGGRSMVEEHDIDGYHRALLDLLRAEADGRN